MDPNGFSILGVELRDRVWVLTFISDLRTKEEEE